MASSNEELQGVLDAIYEGTFDDAAWQTALARVTHFVNGRATSLFSLNPSTSKVHRADLYGMDMDAMGEYQNIWIHQDPRHLAALKCTVGVPQADGMLISVKDHHNTAIFNDFYRPLDIPYHLATWIERSPTRGVVVSVQGSRRHGVFTEEERNRMALLIPHIRRCVQMKDRLAMAQTSATAMLGAMDQLPFGLMLLDRDWHVLEASAVVRDLFSSRCGIRTEGNRLCFSRPADEQAFSAVLAEDRVRATAADSVQVARSGNQSPLSLVVLPLLPQQEFWLNLTPKWLVMVFDPDLTPAFPIADLQRALGITAAEAALARLLAQGRSVIEAADALGITENTARFQLKSIFAKTGLKSQSQLIRRIIMGPAMVGKSS